MAAEQLVPKDELIRELKAIVARRDTGLVTVVTDLGRAVLLRFSQGNLVGAHSRTRDIGEAIGVLQEAERLRFAFAPGSADAGHPPVMPALAFIARVAEGGGAPASAPPLAPPPVRAEAPSAASAGAAPVTAQARAELERLAIDIIGPIAEFLVEEALEETDDLGVAVAAIARSIPDSAVAERFVREARRRLPGLG